MTPVPKVEPDVSLIGGDQSKPQEVVDRIPGDEAFARWNPHFVEEAAKQVANQIVRIFGWAVLGSLAAGVSIIAIGVGFGWQPDSIAKLLNDGLMPYLQAVGALASTVFAPLLAFVLGYYFGEKGKKG